MNQVFKIAFAALTVAGFGATAANAETVKLKADLSAAQGAAQYFYGQGGGRAFARHRHQGAHLEDQLLRS